MSQNRRRRRTGANQKAQQFVILNEMKNLKILSRRFTPSYDQILRQAQDDRKIGLLGRNQQRIPERRESRILTNKANFKMCKMTLSQY
jgi:hypothetical protein